MLTLPLLLAARTADPDLDPDPDLEPGGPSPEIGPAPEPGIAHHALGILLTFLFFQPSSSLAADLERREVSHWHVLLRLYCLVQALLPPWWWPVGLLWPLNPLGVRSIQSLARLIFPVPLPHSDWWWSHEMDGQPASWSQSLATTGCCPRLRVPFRGAGHAQSVGTAHCAFGVRGLEP